MMTNGFVDSGGSGAIALRNSSSSMPRASPVPADNWTDGICTSERGGMTGLATTTTAAANATPVVSTGPTTPRTRTTRLSSSNSQQYLRVN